MGRLPYRPATTEGGNITTHTTGMRRSVGRNSWSPSSTGSKGETGPFTTADDGGRRTPVCEGDGQNHGDTAEGVHPKAAGGGVLPRRRRDDALRGHQPR